MISEFLQLKELNNRKLFGLKLYCRKIQGLELNH